MKEVPLTPMIFRDPEPVPEPPKTATITEMQLVQYFGMIKGANVPEVLLRQYWKQLGQDPETLDAVLDALIRSGQISWEGSELKLLKSQPQVANMNDDMMN
jgi:hypothetical protein